MCTFCNLTGNPDDERETPHHLFYACAAVENVYMEFYNNLLGPDFRDMRRQHYFGVFEHNNTNRNYCMAIINLFKKYIWECKLKKILPGTVFAENYIKDCISTMLDISKKLKFTWQNSGIPWAF